MNKKTALIFGNIMILSIFALSSCQLFEPLGLNSSGSSSSSASSSGTAYNVIYNANGATGGSAPADNNSYQQGAVVSILGNTCNMVNTGYNFAAWNTKADGTGTDYAPGSSLEMGQASITLYAVWLPSSLAFSSSGSTIIITGCSTSVSGNLVIPNGVTGIGAYAFYYCTSMTAVTIPSSVGNIGAYAFQNCYALSSITISQGVTSIGAYSFSNCPGLTAITIPSSVGSIGADAFNQNTTSTLVSVTVLATTPPALPAGSLAFDGMDGHTSLQIYVPAGTQNLYQNATGWIDYSANIFPL
jgi:uncharacterized repeat protein (TIGR02543 family)